MATNGSASIPFIVEEKITDDRELLLWRRFFSGERARVGRPRKDSDAVTWQQLGVSKRTAHRIRTLGSLSPEAAELVATRKMTIREAEERVYGVKPPRNPLFRAWRKATIAQRQEFVDVLENALEQAAKQAAFFAEREDE